MFEQTHMHKAFQDYEAQQQTTAREGSETDRAALADENEE